MTTEVPTRRSDAIKRGFERAPHRALLRATGAIKSEDDFRKPFIAVANSYLDSGPGQVHVHRVGRTGRLSSSEKGVAITFVMRDQGEQLTNIEKRINRMLPEYKVDDYKAFQPRAPRPTVEDKPKFSFA